MIGILADAHGNGPAFDQAIRLLRDLGAERFIFLGDAVGYIPSKAVVMSLRKLGSKIYCILGNHEKMLLQGPIDAKRDVVYNLSIIRSSLNSGELEFIEGWPDHHVEDIAGRRFLFVHGSPANYTNGYIYPDTDLSIFDETSDFVFMGHSHHPFVRRQGSVCYVNVGSCGIPRDDGRFGSSAILDPATGCVCIVRYEITDSTRKALESVSQVHDSVKAILERRQELVYGDRLWENANEI